ncbi:MAG TPA: hypothetical protein VN680_10410 [Burkholderiaceae bacterium]|nr:hypothetical protein [Burkholderiaceae bacterium]
MNRTLALTLAAAFAFTAAGAYAQNTTPANKATQKKSQSRKELQSEAKGLALANEVSETVSANQLEIANRVLTGPADCEMKQTVHVDPIKEAPGHFKLTFKNVSYDMVPQETTTGAVRLEDKKAGVVWLQIPSKSMLMNQKVGQRMVDACMHSEQRAAVSAAEAAAKSK